MPPLWLLSTSKKSWSQIYNINVCSCQCALVSNIEHLRWLPLDGCFSFFFPFFGRLPQTLINISDIITHISVHTPLPTLSSDHIDQNVKLRSNPGVLVLCENGLTTPESVSLSALCTLIKFRKQGFEALEWCPAASERIDIRRKELEPTCSKSAIYCIIQTGQFV